MKLSNENQKNSNKNPTGRYSIGGDTKEYENKLGWWERSTIPKNKSDITINVSQKEIGRADLISYRVYGTTSFDWLVLMYNNIMIPHEELNQNAELVLPSPERLNSEIR